MSYCRFSGGSDVYLFGHAGGYFQCCACRLKPNDDFFDNTNTPTIEGALKHLKEHQDVGHKFPAHAVERLQKELAQEYLSVLETKHRPTKGLKKRAKQQAKKFVSETLT